MVGTHHFTDIQLEHPFGTPSHQDSVLVGESHVGQGLVRKRVTKGVDLQHGVAMVPEIDNRLGHIDRTPVPLVGIQPMVIDRSRRKDRPDPTLVPGTIGQNVTLDLTSTQCVQGRGDRSTSVAVAEQCYRVPGGQIGNQPTQVQPDKRAATAQQFGVDLWQS